MWSDNVAGRWILNNKKDLCFQEPSKARKEKNNTNLQTITLHRLNLF